MTFTRRDALATGLSAVFIGSGLTGRAQAGAALNVVATTGMIADAVRVVGGADVKVQALMGPGVDPHAYRQTRSDILAFTRADLVIWHGLFLEAQMEEFLRKLGKRKMVAAAAEAAPPSILRAHDDYDGKYDPHLWMAPKLWASVIDAVRDALTAARSKQKAFYAANAAAYRVELDKLDAYARTVLASVPDQSRVLVTAHDAFGYFGDAYGYDVRGVQGVSTESEAGLVRIKELVDLLVARQVKAVFVESSVSDRNMRALIEGAAAKAWEVEIGGELFSDAMGEDGTYEGTYLGMFDHNVTVIANALGGAAPAQGRLGRLARVQE